MTTAAAAVLAEAGRLPTGIPPWMGFAIVVGWLAVVMLAVTLFRWRRASRSERRGERGRRVMADTDANLDRQLGPGTDLESW
ncbi:MAG: hypothetical protein QOG64_3141 [Acidimicrobiaceae bacterium]|nr:hypothetical protein [Acidimicrobiaceae bacterium]